MKHSWSDVAATVVAFLVIVTAIAFALFLAASVVVWIYRGAWVS